MQTKVSPDLLTIPWSAKKGDKVSGVYDGQAYSGTIYCFNYGGRVGGEYFDVGVLLDAPMTTSRGHTVTRIMPISTHGESK